MEITEDEFEMLVMQEMAGTISAADMGRLKAALQDNIPRSERRVQLRNQAGRFTLEGRKTRWITPEAKFNTWGRKKGKISVTYKISLVAAIIVIIVFFLIEKILQETL